MNNKYEIVPKHVREEGNLVEDAKRLNIDLLQITPLYDLLYMDELTHNKYKSYYTILGGAKDCGKSKAAALWVVLRFLVEPNRFCMVLRNYNTQNTRSTVPDILWAFGRIASELNMPELNPIPADLVTKGNASGRFVFYKSVPQYIEDTVTGTQIVFDSLQRIVDGGFTPSPNPNHFLDTFWCEELVDVESDSSTKNKDEFLLRSQFDIASSTVSRGYQRKVKGSIDKLEDVPGADPKWVFTFNAHDGDHWLVRDYLDKYVPFDINDPEQVKAMNKQKFFGYYDPEGEGGRGLLVMRLSVYVNKMGDFKKAEELKKRDPKQYAYVYLGADKPIGGFAYANDIYKLDLSSKNREKLWPISIGVDYAISSDYGDNFVAAYLATDTYDTYGLQRAEDMRPGFNYLNYYYEYVHNNSTSRHVIDDIGFAKIIIDRLFELVLTTPTWTEKIQRSGIYIIVDAANYHSFGTHLVNAIKQKMLENPYEGQRWMNNRFIRVVSTSKKNSKEKVDGEVLEARQARVAWNKHFLEERMINISQKYCPFILSDFKKTSIDRNGKVVDKHRDGVDAMDYAWLNPRIGFRFKEVAMTKNKKRKLL